MFRRPSFALLFVLLAPASIAQTADLSVDVINEEQQPTLHTLYDVQAKWDAEVPVEKIVLEFDVPEGKIERVHAWNEQTKCDASARTVRCTMSSKSEPFDGVAVDVTYPRPGTYTATARIHSSANDDPNPANNTDSHTITIAGLPSLRPYGRVNYDEGDHADPAAPARITIGVSNGGERATNTVLRLTLPEGGRLTDVDAWSSYACSVASATEAVCALKDPLHTPHGQYSFGIITPDRTDGGTFPVVVSADADQADYDPSDDSVRIDVRLRDLIAVTNAADDGPGSLRQALLESQSACETVSCIVQVRSATPLVVQPRTALPEVRGRVKVDGGGGHMTVDGSLLPAGEGLRFTTGCEFRVSGMVMRNFDGAAIHVDQLDATSAPCPYSLSPQSVSIRSNALLASGRGIVIKGVGTGSITGNIIRGSRRAGIFADGNYYLRIEGNEIASNGASGMFINAEYARDGGWLPPGADVMNNVVRDNGEWGIARTPKGSVNIVRNSTSGNNLYGIDYGLDLSTPEVPAKPVLTSATYDADRDVTVIRGKIGATPHGYGHSADLYASTSLSRWGYPESERWLATAYQVEFEREVPGDLRGQWITATGTRIVDVIFLRDDHALASGGKVRSNASGQKYGLFRYQANDTSELSDAIRVE